MGANPWAQTRAHESGAKKGKNQMSGTTSSDTNQDDKSGEGGSQSGEGGSGGDQGGSSSSGDQGGSSGDTGGKTFDQADVDRLIGQRVNQATKKAVADTLEALGFDDITTATKSRKDQIEADRQSMSEADRKLAEATDLAAGAAKREAQANEAILRAKISTALVSGAEAVNPLRVGIATDMALRSAMSNGLEGDEQVTSAITDIRALSPEWFTDGSGSGNEDGKSGEGKSGNRTPPPPGQSGQQSKPPEGDAGAAASKSKFDAWKEKRKGPLAMNKPTT